MDLFEVIEKRRSIRKFKLKRVVAKDLKKILEAGRLAPSGGNRQPWCFVVVKDSETKNALALAANNQKFIADAGAVIVAVGIPGVEHRPLSSTRIPFKQDTMIAVEHMILAAVALGYGTCWIGAFDESKVKKILKIPENLAIVALLPVGVPDENPPAKSRKAFRKVFFKETYGNPIRL